VTSKPDQPVVLITDDTYRTEFPTMSPTNIPNHEAPDPGVIPATPDSAIEIRLLTRADDMVVVGEVFQQIWGSSTELVRLEMLMAIAHAGGYVVGAFDTSRRSDFSPHGQILGASVALLATHLGMPALHSHVTGILPGARSTGLGREMKLHQQAWALERGIDWIVWTFDPLVRRNAWFNIAILGAEVHEYLPSFYGKMTDAINAGDESDRLLMAWATATDPDSAVRDGSGISGLISNSDGSGVHSLIPTPDDIVALRRTDPAAVATWRADNREALTAALSADRPIIGFTRSGDYVVGA
jgi:predicted GNAT superfamily acetyltransferase